MWQREQGLGADRENDAMHQEQSHRTREMIRKGHCQFAFRLLDFVQFVRRQHRHIIYTLIDVDCAGAPEEEVRGKAIGMHSCIIYSAILLISHYLDTDRHWAMMKKEIQTLPS